MNEEITRMTLLVFFFAGAPAGRHGDSPSDGYKSIEVAGQAAESVDCKLDHRELDLITKMPSVNLYFASCALLLLLLTLNWRTSTGLPVRTSGSCDCTDCPSLFKDLLGKVTELLDHDDVCHGTASGKALVRSDSETALSCVPNLTQGSGCTVLRNTSFSESECLRNIMKDLVHYAAVFDSYLSSSLRSPSEEAPPLRRVLETIQSLRTNCSLMPNGEREPSEENLSQMWGDDTFSNRQEMCKMIRGFHGRTITINRAMSYICSGNTRK